MIRLFFLLPLAMCAIWYWYLNLKGYTVKQGLRGFIYILSFNAIILLFFVVMIAITH